MYHTDYGIADIMSLLVCRRLCRDRAASGRNDRPFCGRKKKFVVDLSLNLWHCYYCNKDSIWAAACFTFTHYIGDCPMERWLKKKLRNGFMEKVIVKRNTNRFQEKPSRKAMMNQLQLKNVMQPIGLCCRF